MKKLLAVLLIGLLLIPSMAFAEKVKVRWFVGLGTGSREEQIEPQEKVVADFNESQDEIELVLEIVDNDQAYDILGTQIAGGNAPDIVGPVGVRGRESFKGTWLDLKPLIEKHNYDLSDFDPAMVDFYYIEDEGQIGLPFGIYPSFIFVNKDLFEEADLPLPSAKKPATRTTGFPSARTGGGGIPKICHPRRFRRAAPYTRLFEPAGR